MNQNQEFENSNLLLGDLSDVGVELAADELTAVSGAQRMEITGFSGRPKTDDEWIIR